jgi:AcrR family transcriptional regulator
VVVAAEGVRRERPGKVAILRAAVMVMGEDGYEGASTRDMAARAGVSVAALYYHFPTKLDILREFLDDAYEVLLNRLERRLLAAPATPTDRLDEMVGTLIWSALHDDFARHATNVVYREFTRLEEGDRKAIEDKRRRIVQLVERVIVSGVEAGEFRVVDSFETARAVVTLASSLVQPFPDMGRSMEEVIVLYQGYAQALVRQPELSGRPARAPRRPVAVKGRRR